MQTLEMALRDLYNAKQISYEDALAKSSRPDDLAKMLGGTLGAPPAQGVGGRV
jgi:twitching motility protein PilT